MVAFLLAPFYLLLNAYVFIWLLRWMKACSFHFQKNWVKITILCFYSFFALSLLTSFIFPFRWLKYLSNIWFGTVLYIILTIAFVDLIRLILKYVVKVGRDKLSSRRLFVTVGALCIAFIVGISIYGAVNARIIHTTHYKTTIDKSTKTMDSLKIVLVADTHLGYSKGYSHMKQMVEKINTQNPDLVLITGDIFDNSFASIERPNDTAKLLRTIKSTYGTYACLGNHDVEEAIFAGFTFHSKEKKEASNNMYEFLADSNIQLLQDEGVLIDDSIALLGRADMTRPGRGIDKRQTPKELLRNIDPTKAIIVIDHEPGELKELSNAGVDLDLSGHTHNGQMFPGNIVIKAFWENPYGMIKKGSMTSITTSGIGVFGPNMRVGTKAEIVSIDVSFKKD